MPLRIDELPELDFSRKTKLLNLKFGDNNNLPDLNFDTSKKLQTTKNLPDLNFETKKSVEEKVIPEIRATRRGEFEVPTTEEEDAKQRARDVVTTSYTKKGQQVPIGLKAQWAIEDAQPFTKKILKMLIPGLAPFETYQMGKSGLVGAARGERTSLKNIISDRQLTEIPAFKKVVESPAAQTILQTGLKTLPFTQIPFLQKQIEKITPEATGRTIEAGIDVGALIGGNVLRKAFGEGVIKKAFDVKLDPIYQKPTLVGAAKLPPKEQVIREIQNVIEMKPVEITPAAWEQKVAEAIPSYERLSTVGEQIRKPGNMAKLIFQDIKRSLGTAKGEALVPTFKTGDFAKVGNEVGKVLSVEGKNAIISVAGKEIAKELSTLIPAITTDILESSSTTKFNKKFNELKPLEKRQVLSHEDLENKFISSQDIQEEDLSKIQRTHNLTSFWEERQAFANDKSGQYTSDGRVLIIDKDVSQEIRNKYWEDKRKKFIKDLQKTNPNVPLAELEKTANAEILGRKKGLTVEPPPYESIIPKEKGVTTKFIGSFNSDNITTMIFQDAEGNKIGLDAGYVNLVKKHFPDAELRIRAGEGLTLQSAQFWVKGKLKAIVMPRNIPNNVEIPEAVKTKQIAVVPEKAKSVEEKLQDIRDRQSVDKPLVQMLDEQTKLGEAIRLHETTEFDVINKEGYKKGDYHNRALKVEIDYYKKIAPELNKFDDKTIDSVVQKVITEKFGSKGYGSKINPPQKFVANNKEEQSIYNIIKEKIDVPLETTNKVAEAPFAEKPTGEERVSYKDYYNQEVADRENAVKEINNYLKGDPDVKYRLNKNIDNTITIYHGTSEDSANSILKNGKLNEGSFFSHAKSKSAFGSEGAKGYAKGGKILEIKVDPRDVSLGGTGEFYAEKGLVRGEDGIWRSPDRKTFNQLSQPTGEGKQPQQLLLTRKINEIKDFFLKNIVGVYKDPLGKSVKFLENHFEHLTGLDTGEINTLKTKTLPLLPELVQNPDSIYTAEKFSEKYPNGIVYLKEFFIPDSKTKMLLGYEVEKDTLKPISSFIPTKTQLENIKKGQLLYESPKNAGLASQPSSEIPARVTEDSTTRNLPQQEATQWGASIPNESITQETNIVKSENAPPQKPPLPAAEITPAPEQQPQLNAEKYVQEQIAKREAARESEGAKIGKLSKLYKEAKSKLVDFAAPIEDVLRTAQKQGKYTVLPQYHITNQIDRVLRSPTMAGQFARDNGLEKVIKEVDNIDNLDQYLIAKQARTVEVRGIKTGRDLAKDEMLIKILAPRYERYAKAVTDYSRKLLDYSVDSGLISKDLADTLKERYPDYVPINRIFNELEKTSGAFGGGKSVASLSKQTIVQKLEGSEREIENPIASLLEKTMSAFKQGEKNKAAKMLISYKDLPSNPFQIRELPEGESAIHAVSFLDSGVKRNFEVPQDIAQAAKAMNVQQLNILGQIFAFPVRLAKIGITGINLPFILSNIAKDQVTAVINSKNALHTSLANPAVFVKALFEVVGHGKVYEEMAREGTLGTSFDIARNQASLTIERTRAGRNILSKVKYTARHWGELLKAVEDIIGKSEELTRIQQYQGTKQALLEQGLSEKEARIGAARASRENTVNFARRGEWGTVLNSTFLYINANIQGTRTFVRNFRERPIKTAFKMALVVFAPIAIATAWNLSDKKRREAYNDISEFEKKNNIIIIPPEPTKNEDGTWNVIKIPLSQEINNIAGMARKPIEQAFGLEPISVQDIAEAFVGTLSPINPSVGSITSTLTPQAIRPSLEAATNRNFFTGRPQVSPSMEKLSPELQVKSYTSGTARKIGGVLKQSPIKVEEFIRGTVGGVGSQVLNISDRILAGLHIIPKDQIGGQNVIKAIMARFSLARGGHLEDTANKKLESIIRSQADERFRIKQEAEILYEDLKKFSPQEANTKAQAIKKRNPLLFNELKNIVNDEKMNLDYNDRLIKQLGVENGERAKFIWENLKAFKSDQEKNNYIKELKKKKILSERVFYQLKILKKRGNVSVQTKNSLPELKF